MEWDETSLSSQSIQDESLMNHLRQVYVSCYQGVNLHLNSHLFSVWSVEQWQGTCAGWVIGVWHYLHLPSDKNRWDSLVASEV